MLEKKGFKKGLRRFSRAAAVSSKLCVWTVSSSMWAAISSLWAITDAVHDAVTNAWDIATYMQSVTASIGTSEK